MVASSRSSPDGPARRVERPSLADPAAFERAREGLFARTWHVLATEDEVPPPGTAHPATLLPGLLDEPLLMARPASGEMRVLSNVCTHRGALVCESRCEPTGAQLRCRYHGRRFGLDGRCLGAPGFEGTGVPTADDDLPVALHGRWGPLLFTGVRPDHSLGKLLDPLQELIGWLPLDLARLDPARGGDFLVPAHWTLYCENYLEGFHVPFVHPSLSAVLDWQDCEVRLWPHGSVQVAFARADEPPEALLVPPRGHPDHARRVAAYYVWLWPCTMINVYPWGISVNLVQPLAPARTRVRFLSCVWDAGRLESGAGAGLQQVECEDEAVVESVQRGMRARLWREGRLSPRHEAGVAHFRKMLSDALDGH